MKSKENIKAVLQDIDAEVTDKCKYLDDVTLEGGKSGLALYSFFCHKFYGDERYLDFAEKQIEDSIGILSEISARKTFTPKFKTDSLSNHIASFGKFLLFVQYRFDYGYDFTAIYESVSEVLLDLTIRNFKEKDFDINSGALAAGYFFLNRYRYEKDDFSKQALLSICSAIADGAIFKTENEVYWKAPILSDQVYIGLSHGSAMIINFITKVFECGVLVKEDEAAFKLLEKAVAFVMNLKRDFKNGYFPVFYPEEDAKETQFTMCYGDLGILYAVYNASKILKKDSLEKEVAGLLFACCKRQKDINYTYDGGIVYGASGVAFIFNDLYKRSGETEYKIAYEYWYKEILNYRNPDQQEFAGFNNRFEKINKDDKVFNLTLGWGIMGISICLMSGLDPALPEINELLLIGA